jgi:hypothetical protein
MLKKQVCRRPQHGFPLDDHTPLSRLKGFPWLASAFLYGPCLQVLHQATPFRASERGFFPRRRFIVKRRCS